jgi:hypothetical protein
MFGQTVFGQNVFGQTVFGQTVFGQTVFGQTVFGQTVFGQFCFKPILWLDSASRPIIIIVNFCKEGHHIDQATRAFFKQNFSLDLWSII